MGAVGLRQPTYQCCVTTNMERLPELRIEVLEVRPAWPWRLFTYCSWLHMFKQTFYNDLILSKKSSRKGVQYVGDITNPNVWRFFLCVMLEGGLEALETHVPWVMPSFLWNICARKKIEDRR